MAKTGYSRRWKRRAFKGTRALIKYGVPAVKLASDVYKLKQMMNVEFKYSQQNSSTNPTTATNTVLLLNGLTKGDDATDREGRQIKMSSIQYSVRVLMNAAATSTMVRLLLVLDTQPNAVISTIPNILETSGGLYVDAFRNLANRKRYVILRDDKIIVDANTPYKKYDYYKKIGFKTVFNSGNAGTIADINTNALYLCAISDEATNAPNVNIYDRIRFIDN